jgi:S1-C subfamily serine protease
MRKEDEMSRMQEFSRELADTVRKAGAYTLQVDARGGYPASGIALEAKAVLTADHVVEREEDIAVGLPDGRRLAARLLGRDPGSDLALLAVEENLGVTGQAAEAEPEVGELVLSLARPTEEGIEASLGIITARGGPLATRWGGILERYLASAGPRYPGFSGGPLVAPDGRWVGVNTQRSQFGAGVALPAALALRIAARLKTGGVRRGYMGVNSQTVELDGGLQAALGRKQETALLLVGVEEGSPAAAAGLLLGDLLAGFDGRPVRDHRELLERLHAGESGQRVEAELLRGGKPLRLTLTLGDRAARHRSR